MHVIFTVAHMIWTLPVRYKEYPVLQPVTVLREAEAKRAATADSRPRLTSDRTLQLLEFILQGKVQVKALPLMLPSKFSFGTGILVGFMRSRRHAPSFGHTMCCYTKTRTPSLISSEGRRCAQTVMARRFVENKLPVTVISLSSYSTVASGRVLTIASGHGS